MGNNLNCLHSGANESTTGSESDNAGQERFPVDAIRRGCEIFGWDWTDEKLRVGYGEPLDEFVKLFYTLCVLKKTLNPLKKKFMFRFTKEPLRSDWAKVKQRNWEYYAEECPQDELFDVHKVVHELLTTPVFKEEESIAEKIRIADRVDHCGNKQLQEVQEARDRLWEKFEGITDWKGVLFNVFCQQIQTLLNCEKGAKFTTLDEMYRFLQHGPFASSTDKPEMSAEEKKCCRTVQNLAKAYVIVLKRLAEPDQNYINSSRPLLDVPFLQEINKAIDDEQREHNGGTSILAPLPSWIDDLRCKNSIQPLIAATIVQLSVFCVQHFGYGNMRTAMLAAVYVLMSSGYPPIAVPNKTKWDEFRTVFDTVREGFYWDPIPCVRWMADILKSTIEQLIEFAGDISAAESGSLDDFVLLEENYTLKSSLERCHFLLLSTNSGDDQPSSSHSMMHSSTAAPTSPLELEVTSAQRTATEQAPTETEWERREREGIARFQRHFVHDQLRLLEELCPEMMSRVEALQREHRRKWREERERLTSAGSAWAQAFIAAIEAHLLRKH